MSMQRPGAAWCCFSFCELIWLLIRLVYKVLWSSLTLFVARLLQASLRPKERDLMGTSHFRLRVPKFLTPCIMSACMSPYVFPFYFVCWEGASAMAWMWMSEDWLLGFSSHTLWALWIKLRSVDLAANAFTYQTVSLVPGFFFLNSVLNLFNS